MPKLSDVLTLDQVAALTDQEMVRRRFDAGNIRWMAVLSVPIFVTGFVQVILALFAGMKGGHLLPLALAHFVVATIGSAFFLDLANSERKSGTAKARLPVHLLSRNLTPWIITFLLVEFTFLTFFREPGSDDAFLAWAMIVPWLLVPLRLEFFRRAAMHVSIMVLAVVNTLLLGVDKGSHIGEHMAAAFMSTIALAFGGFTSRRLRKQTLEYWRERRTHAREQMRMRDELQYAREVQLSMLPEASPNIEWLDIAASSLPATEVGGDYYDYFIDEHSVAIVCGDVAGHGLGSGIVLASLRSGFMLLQDMLHDPAAVLRRLSTLVAQTSRRRMLATAAVARLERSSRRAIIASAGHPPVMVRHAGAVTAIELFAPPLGVRLPYQVPSREMTFHSGDVFVLHSDGVYEAQNAGGEVYGLDRLARLLADVDGADAAQIRDAIVRDVEGFRGGTPQQDDITIVVARVK